jgi:hypothetical protein
MTPLLELDERIRVYVFLPMLFIVCGVTRLRQKMFAGMKMDPMGGMGKKKNDNDQKYHTALARARVLRAKCHILLDKAFRSHHAVFCKKDAGLLFKAPAEKTDVEKMQSFNTEDMGMNMLKGQVGFIVLQGGLAYWASALFNGFVVGKTPFPLTFQFRPMMLRGIEVPSLDVTYISAFTWYLVILIGSNGLLALLQSIFSGPVEEESALAGMMGGMPPQQQAQSMQDIMGGGGPDIGKLNSDMRDELEICQHTPINKNIEMELLNKWRYGE